MQPYCVTIQQCRRLIGISKTSIYKLINEGKLEKIKVCGRTLITVTSLTALLRDADNQGQV